MFAKYHAKALDEIGSLYFTKENYDNLSPIYGSTYLHNCKYKNDAYKSSKRFFVVALLVVASFSLHAQAAKDYFKVENYYKVKWGYAEEFITLWKKNHYPLLNKAIEKGDIISVEASAPKLHSGEDTRWDFGVVIVFASSQAAFDPNLTTPYKKQLYPDADELTSDEQHRFELLLSHWDIMTDKIALQ